MFINNEARLGIIVSRVGYKVSSQALASSIRDEGFIVRASEIQTWRAAEMHDTGDQIVVSGPGFDGLALDELLSSVSDKNETLQRLGFAAGALGVLHRAGRLPKGILAEGILVANDGGVLVLPPAIIARAFTASGRSLAAYGNGTSGMLPPSSTEAWTTACRILAASIYRVLAGDPEKAFPRDIPVIPLSLVEPRANKGIADLVDMALADPTTVWPDAWDKAFSSAGQNGFFKAISDSEMRIAERRRETAEVRARTVEKRKRILRRWGVPVSISVAVVAVIVVLSLVGGPSPGPDLAKMEPAEIVSYYYDSLDALNSEALESVVRGRAGKDDSRLAVNMMALQKIRMAYESIDPVVKARQWLAAGSPTLVPGTLLFGTTGLQIRSVANPDTETGKMLFEAGYSLWVTETEGDAPIASEQRRLDRLTLEQTKKGWRIILLERTVVE
jgi:hypothetical protein